MKIKTYSGKRMRIVMSQIRKELGPDAVIIATNEDPSGIVVTAAVEHKATKAPITEIIDILQCHLVSKSVLSQFAKAKGGLDTVLKDAIDFAPIKFAERSRLVLVGPPGVGKSLVVAKLAAQHTGKTHLITADRRKSGAIEQTMKYAQNINVPCSVIENPLLLRTKLSMIGQDTLVIVDTPGVNPFNPDDMQYIAALVKACEVAPILVLPANLSSEELNDMATVFIATGAKDLIVTKCDIARRLGGIVDLLINHDLQLAAMGFSSITSHQLLSGSPVILAKLLMQKFEVQLAA